MIIYDISFISLILLLILLIELILYPSYGYEKKNIDLTILIFQIYNILRHNLILNFFKTNTCE